MKVIVALLVIASYICTVHATYYCKAPPAIENGYHSGGQWTKFSIGKVIRYSCRSGYQLQGSPISTCLLNRNTWSSFWSNRACRCIRRKYFWVHARLIDCASLAAFAKLLHIYLQKIGMTKKTAAAVTLPLTVTLVTALDWVPLSTGKSGFPAQALTPLLSTPVTVATHSLEAFTVNVYQLANGMDLHQLANVSLYTYFTVKLKYFFTKFSYWSIFPNVYYLLFSQAHCVLSYRTLIMAVLSLHRLAGVWELKFGTFAMMDLFWLAPNLGVARATCNGL